MLRLLLFVLLFGPLSCWAQDTLQAPADSALEFDDLSIEEDEPTPIPDPFNAPYLINGPSTSLPGKGILNFYISHRFGSFQSGGFNLWGLDYSSIRLGFEYGILPRLSAGIGRSSAGKNYDGYLKYKLLRQHNQGGAPVSVVAFSSAAFSGLEIRNNEEAEGLSFSDFLVYSHQVVVSRKFGDWLTLQATPFMLHRNSVEPGAGGNDLFGISGGFQVDLNARFSIIGEFHQPIGFEPEQEVYSPAALGVDINAGGHVFKIYVGNAHGMIAKEYITNNFSSIADGDLRLGFTVVRSFALNPEVKGSKIFE